ncbi:MAG TPA: hypothetical protein VGG21_05835 [Acidimicrobiales bacterium]|jgi:hypothetical protein
MQRHRVLARNLILIGFAGAASANLLNLIAIWLILRIGRSFWWEEVRVTLGSLGAFVIYGALCCVAIILARGVVHQIWARRAAVIFAVAYALTAIYEYWNAAQLPLGTGVQGTLYQISFWCFGVGATLAALGFVLLATTYGVDSPLPDESAG